MIAQYTESVIEYKGIKYPLVLDLYVVKQIQDKYGSLDALLNIFRQEYKKIEETSEETDNIGEFRLPLDDIVFIAQCMMEEGIDIANEEGNEKIKPLTTRQIYRMLSEIGIDPVLGIFAGRTTEDLQSADDNPQEKNG